MVISSCVCGNNLPKLIQIQRRYKNKTYVYNYQRKVCYRCQSKAAREKFPDIHRKYGREANYRKYQIICKAKSISCADCGEIYPPYVMDFDHLRDKCFNFNGGVSAGKQRLINEMAKCEVVCANCHRERTHNRREKRNENGDI